MKGMPLRIDTDPRVVLEQLRELRAADPGHALTAFYTGRAMSRLGDADAHLHYAAAVELDPLLGGNAELALEAYEAVAAAAVEPARATRIRLRFLLYFPLDERADDLYAQLTAAAGWDKAWIALYQNGVRLQKQRLLGDAIPLLRRVVDKCPTFFPAWFRLGASLRATGRAEEAVEALQTASRLDPNARICLELANTWRKLGDAERQEQCLRQALALHPDETQALVDLATLREEKRASGEVIYLLERAVNLAPDASWADASDELLTYLIMQYQLDWRVPVNEPVQWRTWSDPEFGVSFSFPHWLSPVAMPDEDRAAGCLLALQNESKSVHLTAAVHRAQPSSAPHFGVEVHGLESICDGTRELEANGLTWTRGEFRDPRSGLVTACMHHHADDATWFVVTLVPWAIYQRDRAVLLDMLGSLQLASRETLLLSRREYYEELLTRDALNIEALQGLADIMVQSGEFAAAEKLFNQIVKLNPRHAKAHTAIALCLWRQGKIDGAIKKLESAVQNAPEPEVLEMLLRVYEARGSWGPAVKFLRANAKRFSRSTQMQLALAHALLRHDQADEALSLLQTVLRQSPRELDLGIQVAEIYLHLGRPVEGAAVLERYWGKGLDENLDAQVLLAQCFIADQKIQVAERLLTTALQFDPQHDGARSQLELLQVMRRDLHESRRPKPAR